MVTVKRVMSSGLLFDKAYGLLKNTFDEDVLDSKKDLNLSLEELRFCSKSSRYILIVCLDDNENVISLSQGDYMPILDESFNPIGKSFGAIGHEVTAEEHRCNGYGSELLKYFESIGKHISDERGEEFLGLACEAEDRSREYFRNRGFLHPEKSMYFQPPLEFDKITGERIYDEVRETLLFRPVNDLKTIDRKLLEGVVRSMYEFWCAPKSEGYFKSRPEADLLNPEAIKRARDYIFKIVYRKFTYSLGDRTEIRLIGEF